MITIRSGSTPRRHRPRSAASSATISDRRRLLFQTLDHDIGPSSAQHIQHLAAIHTIVRYQDQGPAITAGHAREPELTPSPSAPRHSVPDIAQPASHPTHGFAQAGRRRYRDDHEARLVASADQWHMPFHQPRIIDRRHQMHAAVRHVRGQPSPLCRCGVPSCTVPSRSARASSSIDRRTSMTCLLIDVCHSHLVSGRHASILRTYLCCADSRAGVSREIGLRSLAMATRHFGACRICCGNS